MNENSEYIVVILRTGGYAVIRGDDFRLVGFDPVGVKIYLGSKIQAFFPAIYNCLKIKAATAQSAAEVAQETAILMRLEL